MADQGIWVLFIIVFTSRHEIKLVPYEQFPNYQLCRAWRDRESLDRGLPMTCSQEHKDEI